MELIWLCLVVCVVPVTSRGVEQGIQGKLGSLLHRHRRYNEQCGNTTIDLTAPTDIEDSLSEEPYLDNSDCYWTIDVPVNNKISVVSRDFLLEDSYNCRYDVVEIFDGELAPRASLGKFCGRTNIRLISRTNRLIIHFRSDASVTAPGFRLELAKLPASSNTTCNKTFSEDSGTLMSLNYPARYPHNVTCLYHIQAPDDMKVTLEFEDFVLERGHCSEDYLTVYDGQSSASTELGTYCGRNAPRSITSSSHSLLLYFNSNDFVREKGFKIKYKFVDEDGNGANVAFGDAPPEHDPDCSSTITQEGGNLTSPQITGEDSYLQRKRCRTVIQPPEGHGVIVRFRLFDLEESLDCIYDHLNVTYNLKEGGSTTTRLCGYQRRNSLCFRSWNGSLTLHFKSDILFEGSGYKADYSFIHTNETGTCEMTSCADGCRGYCYNNGGGFSCACPSGKIPPQCVQNITWLKPLEENITRYEGSDIKLSCAVNHPHTITVWDSNDFMLPNETKAHINVEGTDGSHLKINRARVGDGGRYTCTVQAGDWLMTRSVNLTIKPEEEYCGNAPDTIINPNANVAFGTIAGKNATKAPDVIPWQVHLWDRSKESHHCGGVLISERHVLTAAHCVEGPKATDFNHNNIRVSVGTLSCNHADAEVRKVARYKTHPNYNSNTLKYDFALLELDRPIMNKSDTIYPVCLPTSPGVWGNNPTGYRGVISGCGKDSHGEGPRLVHMASVPVVERALCKSHQQTGNRTFSSDMFCAGYKQGDIGDACEGDSGGPFVAKIDDRWTLLGLISFGRACAEEGEYGYYANVSYALSWLKEFAPVCGRTRFISGNFESGKILHGERALPKQFPWQAALKGPRGIRCSVTLISNKWALTTSHCFNGLSYAQKKKMKVIVGDLTPLTKTDSDSGRRVLTIDKRFIKGFPINKTPNELANDLTLLKLGNSVDFDDYVQPLCLPSQDELMPSGEFGSIAGWGKTSKSASTSSEYLLYATLEKANSSLCNSEWRRTLPTDVQCFVGKNKSIQAGPGDSGSPMAWEYQGRHILSAVHVVGNIYQDLPGLFLDIHSVVPWIKEKMGWTEDEE